MTRSFRKNPRAWWKAMRKYRAARAQIKKQDNEANIDHGYYRKLSLNRLDYIEGTEWYSWERWLAMNRDVDPDMDVVDEWEQYLIWQKRIMRK